MEWQGVLGWVMAVAGSFLWLWEAYKVVQRQQLENAKMKEMLMEATAAMRSLYQAHENALKFYREIVSSLLRQRQGEAMRKKQNHMYVVKLANRRYTDSDPVAAVKKAQEEGHNGELLLQGFFTAPRRFKKAPQK